MTGYKTALVFLRRRILRARELGPLVGLIALGAIFQAINPSFLSANEMTGLTTIASSVGIVGVGVTFLMISGEFDLSVGAMYAFCPIVMGALWTQHGFNEWTAFATAIACAAGIGLLNGLITTRIGIPSFITTLGTLFALNGVILLITGGLTIEYYGNSRILPILGGQLGTSPFYAPIAWMVGIGALFWFILQRTRYGNWTLAAGAPGGIARAVGVPVAIVKNLNFIVAAVLAGFAGCTEFGYLGAVTSGQGQDMNLYAIVVAVLGGTSLFGVTGTIIGTLIGALILGTLETGLVLIGAPGSLYTTLIGLILIAAVIVNVRMAKSDLLQRWRT